MQARVGGESIAAAWINNEQINSFMSTARGLGGHEEGFDLSVTSYTPQGPPEQQCDNLELWSERGVTSTARQNDSLIHHTHHVLNAHY